jgi:lysophospholipid acyltransferase (LPLAT)-like uncharacterized protein
MYRVDELPAVLRPWVALYGWVVATVLQASLAVLRATMEIEHINRPTGQTVQCAWHEGLIPYFLACLPFRDPNVWLNHPLWVVKGVHVFLRRMGVRALVMGSSGHGGRQALSELVPMVAAGASTFLNPDGPAGPAYEVKDGVLDIAQQTGVGVVALRLACSHAWRLPTWDRKLVPWPGSRLRVHYSSPFIVTAQNRGNVRAALKDFMDGRASG